MFFSQDVDSDVSISWSDILLSVIDNFTEGKWTKIERNDNVFFYYYYFLFFCNQIR